MLRKKICGLSLAIIMGLSGTALAAADTQPAAAPTNLVERIRNAGNPPQQPAERENIQKRIDELMTKQNQPAAPVESKSPKVAVIYVNNTKSTYDKDIDNEIFKYLNQALPKGTYELIDGSPYVEILNKMGYTDISAAERADFIDAFNGSGIDYCVYLEIQPFIIRDKMTFFTIGKDITVSVPLKMINLGTGKYLYNGKFTEKASDSTIIGDLGNKSVALKGLRTIGNKVLTEINTRLPKTKVTTEKQP